MHSLATLLFGGASAGHGVRWLVGRGLEVRAAGIGELVASSVDVVVELGLEVVVEKGRRGIIDLVPLILIFIETALEPFDFLRVVVEGVVRHVTLFKSSTLT